MPLRARQLLVLPIVAVIALIATAVQVSAATLAVSTSSLPAAEVSDPYSHVLAATGGTSPYVWSIQSGTLPAGLSLNSATGQISGTPTTQGIANVTVQVTDADLDTATRVLSVVVHPAVSVSTSLPGGQVGSAYTGTLASTGGVGAFAWDISAGSLPAGLVLNSSTGVISGTPTTAAVSAFTARVTDALGVQATQALSITVVPASTLQVTTATLGGGSVGAAYSQALSASGGSAPYTWSIASGGLAPGLTLNTSTGALTGAPTMAGEYTFTAMVTDSASATASRSYTIAVSPLTVATASLPQGEVGEAYSVTLDADGGSTPYVWAVIAGGLPAGMTLNPATGAITGTPTAVGVWGLVVRVTDANDATALKLLSIAVVSELDATPTATGTATPAQDKGLCNAYFRGSETGMANKRQAPPFLALAERADEAGQSVEEYCGQPASTAESEARKGGEREPQSSQGSQGNGKANGREKNR